MLGTRSEGGLHYVEMRNPWGTGGIAYDEGERDDYGSGQSLIPREDNEGGGEFFIELIHFMATFKDLDMEMD